MKFYIADMHLGDERALKFDNRPFRSIEEQNKQLLDNWNNKVGPGDTVYVLGDFAFDEKIGREFLEQANGMKVLILGNHDTFEDLNKCFDEVHSYLELKDRGYRVILCHYPIAHWRWADNHSIHLFGHLHNERDNIEFEKYICRMLSRRDENTGDHISYNSFNTGCMMPYMNYEPMTVEEIRRGGRKYHKKHRKANKKAQ